MNSSVKNILEWRIAVSTVIAVVCVALGARGAGNDAARSLAFSTFASAPLYFEANAGQAAGNAQFIARGAECSVLIAPTEAEIVLGETSHKALPSGAEPTRTVRLQLVGANPEAKLTGCGQMPATANYFIGNDPSKWHAGVPLFSRVRIEEVYPGVQVVYYANQSAQLEYDFVLQAGVHPEEIRFRIEGADSMKVDAAGNLILKIGGDEIRQHRPVVYQETGGERRQIPAGYHLNRDGTVGLVMEGYDGSSPLVIDPSLDFLTYLGSNKMDIGWAIALDTNDNIYVTGETLSKNLPTRGAIVFTNAAGKAINFTNFQGGTPGFGDAFVASYDTNGSLRYLTYLGGKKADGALDIAADGGGGVWLTGFTDSTDFPITTNNALPITLSGPNNNARRIFPADAFIAHLDPTGSNLDYSTYFGGSGLDEGIGIAAPFSNTVYVTGLTTSTNLFGVTNSSYQTNLHGDFDAFVAKFTDGTNSYTTYLGGTNTEYGLSIAVDSQSNAWVTGITFSTNFPTTTNSLTQLAAQFPGHTFTDLNDQTNSPRHNSSFHSDAFVSEISPDGTALLFSAYLGGTNDDSGSHLTIDSSDNVYITGYTISPDFPTNVVTIPQIDLSSFPTNEGIAFPGGTTNFLSHVFVTEITNQFGASNYGILYSTAFGGNGADRGTGIAVDANGNAYVTGATSSTNFFATNLVILTNNVPGFNNTNRHGVITNYTGMGVYTNNLTFTNLSNTNATARLSRTGLNTNDIFVAVLAPGGSNFIDSIILGGPGIDEPNGIAVDTNNNAIYLVGSTTSRTNFATTNAAQQFSGGGRQSDAFIGKIQLP